jgi:hypothetical protein
MEGLKERLTPRSVGGSCGGMILIFVVVSSRGWAKSSKFWRNTMYMFEYLSHNISRCSNGRKMNQTKPSPKVSQENETVSRDLHVTWVAVSPELFCGESRWVANAACTKTSDRFRLVADSLLPSYLIQNSHTRQVGKHHGRLWRSPPRPQGDEADSVRRRKDGQNHSR